MIVVLSACILGAVSIAVWFIAAGARGAARVQLRFAGLLFASLAVASIVAPSAADEVALLVAALATTILALGACAGFEQRAPAMPASLVLSIVCLAGLAAAMTGVIAFALTPATLAAFTILIFAARQFDSARFSSVQAMLSALALLAAASSFAFEGAGSAHLLFSATGLLGLTLALSRPSDFAVEEQRGRDLRHGSPVGEQG